VFGLLILAMFVFVLLTLWRVLSLEFKTVPEEERLVIYRLGRFHRLAGPGLIGIWRRWERIERTLQVRDQPHSVTLVYLYIYDIPFGYTMTCWYRIDPEEAANGNPAVLRKLVQFDDDERHQQFAVKLRELFVKHVATLQRQHRLPGEPSILDKLLPILPGQPEYQQLLETVQRELSDVLQPIGLIPNGSHSIASTNLHIPPSVLKLLDRNRMMQTLQRQLPHLSEEMVLQAASADDGMALHTVRKFIFEHANEEQASVEWESVEDGVRLHMQDVGHRNIPDAQRRRACKQTAQG